MNREILFRGKADDEWVYGDLGRLKNAITITKRNFIYPYIVMPETVGQFTGLTDKNGVKIFEGDILKFRSGIYSVEWDNEHSKFLQRDGQFSRELHIWIAKSEIVGNIHDNPELLKGEENE